MDSFAEGRNGDYLLIDTDPSEKGISDRLSSYRMKAGQENVVASSLEEVITQEIEIIKKRR